MRDQINKADATKSYDNTDAMLTDLGLDFEVGLRQSHLAGNAIVDDIPVIGEAIFNQHAICKIEDGRATPLGGGEDKVTCATVTDNYHVIQNREAFGIIDGLVEAGATLTRYGVTKGGQHSFIELDLGKTDIAAPRGEDTGRKDNYGFGNQAGYTYDKANPGTDSQGRQVGDIVKRLITVNVYHDGSHSVMARIHNERLICLNGLTSRDKEGANIVKIRHSKEYRNALVTAKDLLGVADAYYKWFEDKCRDLYNRPITRSIAGKLLGKLYPSKVNDDGSKPKRDSKRVWREDIMERFTTGMGNNGKTYWDLFNGITEHFDHKETKRTEVSQYRSRANGSDNNHKVDAFELLLESHDLACEYEAHALNESGEYVTA